MNQWKAAHAVKTEDRTLEEAVKGRGCVLRPVGERRADQGHGRLHGRQPDHLCHGQPDPEITPEEVAEVRDDAIVATGRSDYPNQVNNVLGFPYIFRGALDVRATTINDAMKIAAANALAELAREDVPDEVASAYQGTRPRFGPNYIIPVPFDPRLISAIPSAVAKAAAESGVARRPIVDDWQYRAAAFGTP
jgi:malate dehydrogenase (oxaloacetate-decarboxylating)(NADP+)